VDAHVPQRTPLDRLNAMMRPNPTVAAMAPSALAVAGTAADPESIVPAQNLYPPTRVVLYCTDYRAPQAAPALEATLGTVNCSNSALMYACLERLGIDFNEIRAGGYLFGARN